MPDRFIGDLPIGTNIKSADYVVGISGSRAVKMQCGNFLGGTWEELQDKPFDSLNSEYFTINAVQDSDGNVSRVLSLNSDAIIPEETKQQISTNTTDISSIKSWTSYEQTITVKESDIFEGSTSENIIGSGMSYNENLFQICMGLICEMGLTFSNEKISGDVPFIKNDNSDICNLSNTESSIYGNNIDNINAQMDGVEVIGIGSVSTSDGTYYFPKLKADSGGVNFSELSTMMTTGTQSGITVTADTENQRFNFDVTGFPAIAIDVEGYWTINGERGENPTKAQGEKGNDGVSPTVSVAETETGATITITDNFGTSTVDISNGTDGVDGITPHIDETTKHWMIGYTDTNIIAEGVTTISTTSVTYTGTLSVDGWVGDSAPYTQDIEIIGITSDLSPFIDLIVSDDITMSDEEMTQWSYITKATTSDNTIAFRCNKVKPTIELNFKVKVV